jgi:DNA-directed RNA polymerase III subunit RPC8
LVRIRPEDFSKRTIEALEDNLNEKYANKVIQNIGLAICVYDILWAGDDTGIISQGDGYANVNVEFRLVVFHPFKGEVMNARIRNSTPAGINLKIDFFDDIFIPYDMLPEGCE